MMNFSIRSYQRANPPKWVPGVTLYEVSGGKITMTPCDFYDNLFDSKEEADGFAENDCLQRGYTKHI